MLEFRPKHIIVVVEFDYNSKKTKGVPNDIRRSFMGLDWAKPNIPNKLKDLLKTDDDIIYPIHFALIKKPIKMDLPETKKGYSVRNAAVGAMVLYEYLGLFQELGRFVDIFDKFIKDLITNEKNKHFSACKDYKIIIGKDWKDVK